MVIFTGFLKLLFMEKEENSLAAQNFWIMPCCSIYNTWMLTRIRAGCSKPAQSSTGRNIACSVAKSCPPLCDAMDCSLPGSSVHGIFQARILDWVAISFSRVSFKPRNETLNSCVYWIGRQIICHWTTWEARGQNIKYDKITILNDVTEKKTHLVTFIKVEYFCPHWRTKYFLVHKIFCLCTKGWLWYPSLQPIQVESLE